MNENVLMVLAGSVMSMVFAYYPPAKRWYEKLNRPAKANVMVIAMALVAIAGYIAGCYTPWSIVSCNQSGIQQLVEMFVAGLITNQTAYMAFVRPRKKREAKPNE